MRARHGLAAALPAAVALAGGPAGATDGEALFLEHCAACHGERGEGVPSVAPPLQDPALWQRLGPRARDYVAGVIVAGLSGRLTAAGQTYVGLVMPPQGGHESADLAELARHVFALAAQAPDAAPDAGLFDALKADPPSHAELRALRKGG